jgi:ferric-dicitrate binding protein FerR (iron transport regulator)
MEKELLYRFFQGDATLHEERQIREWMEASPEQRRVFFAERKFFDAATLHVGGEDAAVPKVRHSGRIRLLKELVRVAAVAALTLTVSFLYQSRQPAAPDAMQTISVPAGQRVNITLPDGSELWLNARTQLRYPVSFNGRARVLELDGEAYFKVAANTHKPFIVRTVRGTVEVTGTEFNVEAYSSSPIFETALMTGEVRVRLNNSRDGEEVVLSPDRKAVLRDGQLLVEAVEDYAPYRWREGLICFRNASFEEIMADFEKYYGVSVQVKNRRLKQSFYTGKFRHSDGLDYALRVLQKDIRFTYSRDDENEIIYIE